MVHKWKKIGVVGVDSGQLVMTDPAYIESELPKYDELSGLKKSKQVKKTTDQSKQVNFKRGHIGAGVVFRSGFGDGLYNVFADIKKMGNWEKRVAAVKVELITPKETKMVEKLIGNR